jgi:hypothetical protein
MKKTRLPYSRLQEPPDEQGGVSQRSSCPQQVLPALLVTFLVKREATDRILLISCEPQSLQQICVALSPPTSSFSKIAPHF